ncbi:OmpA family protein [Candidatus Comchoanobacter bicostacola]|uniref:OmpA family protein n=1 Tax=Candidatus Comchoanobacter bicostacola TaxID=2919598 RepID=A0ABY5DJG6_9GAMM|nr:OmpA family protein [Candidatus Comchoanobacter bicostacola]UTC24464.1 OmpA family protein [Candidatus Comchoanobacter bicostacola]
MNARVFVVGLLLMLTGCGGPRQVDIEFQRFAQVSYFVDGTRLVVNSNLFFEPDRVTLRPEAVLVLRSLFRQVQEEPFSRIEITAHCDDALTGQTASQITSYQAEMVAGYFWFKGVSPTQIEFSGKGFSESIASMDTAQGIYTNQRIEVRLT